MNALKFKCIRFLREHEEERVSLQIIHPFFKRKRKEAAAFLSHDQLPLSIIVRLCPTTTASYRYAFIKRIISARNFFPKHAWWSWISEQLGRCQMLLGLRIPKNNIPQFAGISKKAISEAKGILQTPLDLSSPAAACSSMCQA